MAGNLWATDDGVYFGYACDHTEGKPPVIDARMVLPYVGDRHIVTLVPRVAHNAGYSLFSLTRACAVVNCQSAFAWFWLRLSCQAATSSTRACLSGIRRSRHCEDRTLSSDLAMFSQLPCFGV